MVNIDIDLEGPRKGEIISDEVMRAVLDGCVGTYLKLGLIRFAVKTFKVNFVRFDEKQSDPGPRIMVIFQDPLGNEKSLETDYRFLGSGKSNPTSEQISHCLCHNGQLPRSITKHLERCKERIKEAQGMLSVWMPDKPKKSKVAL